MPSERLPARSSSRPPAVPGAGVLAPAQPQPLAHDAGELQFDLDFVDREQAWEALGENVRRRVDEKLGDLVEWWALARGGRTWAAVLGTSAFVTLTPTTNAAGGAAQSLRSLPLVEGTFRTAPVTGTTPARGAGGQGGGSRPGGGAGGGRRPLVGRIRSDVAGFLGNLPERAQHLLQEPFADPTDRTELWNDHYYVRETTGGDYDPATLTVWCYLANRRHVTFAHGVGHGRGDLAGPMTWTLTCWRADVGRDG